MIIEDPRIAQGPPEATPAEQDWINAHQSLDYSIKQLIGCLEGNCVIDQTLRLDKIMDELNWLAEELKRTDMPFDIND